MDEINIYIATTGKGPGRQHIAGTFLIEFIVSGKPITTELGSKGTYVYSDSSTAQRVTVNLLTRAVSILPQMMRRYIHDPPERVKVWIDEQASSPFINRWYETWAHNGYIKSTGQAIENAMQWEDLNGAISKSGMQYDYSTIHHSYTNVMHEEASRILSENSKKPPDTGKGG